MSDEHDSGDTSSSSTIITKDIKKEDDCVDEVKVFRKEEQEDDVIDNNPLQDDDKQDVAYEAEMESAGTIGASNGLPNITQGLQNIFMNSPYYSPYYAAAAAVPIIMSPQYQQSINQYMMYQKVIQQQQANLMQQIPSVLSNPSTPKSTPGPIRTPKSLKENRNNNSNNTENIDKKPHIKKPLNAYMIFMKETRAKLLQQEGNATKQSAELNAEMGKMWQNLSAEEQKIYFEKAKILKDEHEKMYPGWSARDNYALSKKKKLQRKYERSNNENVEQKKCRARYGIDNADKWCRHCKRKKRCLNVYDDNEHSSSSSEGSPTPNINNNHSTTPINQHVQIPNTSQFDHQQQQRTTTLFQNNLPLQPPFGMPSPFFGMNPFAPFSFGFQQQPIQSQQPPPIIHPSTLIQPKPEITESNKTE